MKGLGRESQYVRSESLWQTVITSSILSLSVQASAAVCPRIDLGEGLSCCGHGNGRRWTPDTLSRSSWSIHRWFWRPSACAAFSTCGSSGTRPSSMAARLVADQSATLAPCLLLLEIGYLGGIGRMENGNALCLGLRMSLKLKSDHLSMPFSNP